MSQLKQSRYLAGLLFYKEFFLTFNKGNFEETFTLYFGGFNIKRTVIFFYIGSDRYNTDNRAVA